ncbi:SsrA-binding protein SmpB [Tuwongella immobilis]|uniref:SsrA-binding protein n=1 Tax=Tuwongella immobilis TaxID=692036 RepID=A0A6C2YVU2_9BACT|nr:SsrA-binding protein SmpB [Tuwongella immobilis]VIP05501.1 -binding protein : SsrA-binding protein OS=Isosphaera pallida (strain ATCC 43644 / DSM 9630 / IS1B) GN=smpB PE=3 SV=1: SmpB [Tuwongella immobilis]VTS08358.1 -binding protein : SsrA-binding protein OS=Isosphaera pallida (strain ATCC 43644 / DSM 9630 / IS1B) GN=smpB PE=3 SV=1: SmpB [Tuwongella immobilis]
MAGKGKKESSDGEIRMVCRNRRASFDYELSDKLECGIVLVGTEVKSLRDGHANLDGAYASIENEELWLIDAEIPEYAMGNLLNHKPKRTRKLLVHRREIAKFAGKASLRGYTLVPLAIYFRNGRAKVEIAVAKGKQLHDKRESLKNAEANRDIQRAMRSRSR